MNLKKDNTINKYYDIRKDLRYIENIVVKNIEQNDKYNNSENEKRYMYSLSNDEMRKILDNIDNICKKWD